MKSFITFLLETDLNPYQKNWVRSLYTGRESIPSRIVHDSDYHPVGVGGHNLFNLHAGNRGPINLPDYGGEYGNRRDNYLKARKHELSKHVFDPSNPDIPGSVHNGPEHPNTVRIIPFEVQKMEPHPDLIRHLGDHGYDIHDFENGLAIKRGGKNKERIGKILAKTKPRPTDAEAWIRWSMGSKHFERSRELHSLAQTHEIMISKDPFHIAEQSTGKRTWSSCLTLPNRDGDHGGCNHRHLVGDILGGTHAAYLIPKGSYERHKPLKAIARMTLRQYNSGDHSVLRPAGIVYGYHPHHPVSRAFASSLSSFTEKHFPFDKDKERYHVEWDTPNGDHGIYTDSFTSTHIDNPDHIMGDEQERFDRLLRGETGNDPFIEPKSSSSKSPKFSSSKSPTQKLKGGLE